MKTHLLNTSHEQIAETLEDMSYGWWEKGKGKGWEAAASAFQHHSATFLGVSLHFNISFFSKNSYW